MFMFLGKMKLSTLCAILVAFSILFGSLVHSSISHSHAHDNYAAESIHAALRHDEKLFVLLTSIFALIVIEIIKGRIILHSQSFFRFIDPIWPLRPDFVLLRRGVLAYRKFR